jgi:hypothetical protein
MPTPKFDNIAIEFLKLVPDEFETAFTPGMAMPNGFVLTKDQVVNYVNRALHKLFNDSWLETAKAGTPKKQKELFIGIFPELLRLSNTITLPYVITTSELYRDIFKLFGANRNADNLYIRIWEESRLTHAIAGKYLQFKATATNPAIIQTNQIIHIFPTTLTDKVVKIQYIRFPVDPTNGNFLTQNGDSDSPYFDYWNTRIAQIAFEIYLAESQQTA